MAGRYTGETRKLNDDDGPVIRGEIRIGTRSSAKDPARAAKIVGWLVYLLLFAIWLLFLINLTYDITSWRDTVYFFATGVVYIYGAQAIEKWFVKRLS